MTKLGGLGGYRGKPKPKLPHHLKHIHLNTRIQRWMIDELKKKGAVGIVLEDIHIKAGFKYCEPATLDKGEAG